MLLCEEHLFNNISQNTNWINGRPTEILINGTQLHYYAISYETIEKKITAYDDITFYVYGTAIALNDNSGLYNKLKGLINGEEIKTKRRHNAIDVLVHRNRALKQIMAKESDPILRINIGLEIIELLLKAIALSDGVQFDKRKRFFTTALTGNHGRKMLCKLNSLITSLSDISNIDNHEKSYIFMQIIDECIEATQ